jgi:tetratricopeptide (TPR) repeat protein
MGSLLNEYHENLQSYGYFHPLTIQSGYLLSQYYDEQEGLGQSPQYIILTLISSLVGCDRTQHQGKQDDGALTSVESAVIALPSCSSFEIFLLFQKAFGIPLVENYEIPSRSFLRYRDLEGLLNYWSYPSPPPPPPPHMTLLAPPEMSVTHENALKSLIKLFELKIIPKLYELKTIFLQVRVLQVYGALLQFTRALDQALLTLHQSVELLQAVASDYDGDHPLSFLFRLTLCHSFDGIGVLLTRLGQHSEAESYLSKALQLCHSLQQSPRQQQQQEEQEPQQESQQEQPPIQQQQQQSTSPLLIEEKDEVALLPMLLLQVTIHLGDLYFSSSQSLFSQFSSSHHSSSSRGSTGWSNVEKCYELAINLCDQQAKQSDADPLLKFRCKYLSSYLTGRLGVTLQRQAAILIQDSCELLHSQPTNEVDLLPESRSAEAGAEVEAEANGMTRLLLENLPVEHLFGNEFSTEGLRSSYLLRAVLHSHSDDFSNPNTRYSNSISFSCSSDSFLNPSFSAATAPLNKTRAPFHSQVEIIQQLIEWGCFSAALSLIKAEINSKHSNQHTDPPTDAITPIAAAVPVVEHGEEEEEKELRCDEETADLVRLEADMLRLLSKLPAACERYELAIKLYSSLQCVLPTIRCLSGLAKCYQLEGDFKTSLRVFRKAISLLLKKSSSAPSNSASSGSRPSWLPEFRSSSNSSSENETESTLLLCDLLSDLTTLCCDQGFVEQAFYLDHLIHKIHLHLSSAEEGPIPELKVLRKQLLHCQVLYHNQRYLEARELLPGVMNKFKSYYLSLEERSFPEVQRYRQHQKQGQGQGQGQGREGTVEIADCLYLQGLIELHHTSGGNGSHASGRRGSESRGSDGIGGGSGGGDLRQALELLFKAMNIYKLFFPKLCHFTLLPVIEAIAQCHTALGFFHRAETEFHQILKIFTHLTDSAPSSDSPSGMTSSPSPSPSPSVSASPVVGRAYKGLGDVKLMIGMFDEAKGYYDHSAKIIERSLGPYHPLTWDLLLSRAHCELMLGNYSSSKDLYNRFSALKNTPLTLSLTPLHENELQHTNTHTHTATTKPTDNTATAPGRKTKMSVLLSSSTDHYSSASTASNSSARGNSGGGGSGQRSLFTKVKEFHPFTSLLSDIASSLPISSFSHHDGLYCYHMALRHLHFGEYSLCLKLLDTSLHIFQTIYHKRYPLLSSILHHQALALLSSGMDYKAALRAIKRSLQLRRGAYGEESVPVAESYSLLGRLECDRGDYRESEDTLLKAQVLLLKCYGVNSIAVARVKDSLGKLYTLLSRYEEARRCLNESLIIRRELMLQASEGQDQREDQEEEQREDEKESKDDCHDSVSPGTAETVYGAEVGDTYTLLTELALTQHIWSEAERYCLKSIEIYEKCFQDLCPHHPKLLNSRGNLGLIYLLSKKRGGEGRDYVQEGGRLIDDSLRRLLYGSQGNESGHANSPLKQIHQSPQQSQSQSQEQPTYHSYHHPWIKKFQLRYCLPASHPSSPRSHGASFSPGGTPPPHQQHKEQQLGVSDQVIESNLLFENYQLRSKNDELQRLLQGLQSQIQTLESRLQTSEEMNATGQEMIRSLKAQLTTASGSSGSGRGAGGRGGGRGKQIPTPLALLSSGNGTGNYLPPQETLEQREGIPLGMGGDDEIEDEDSSGEYLPKIGTIARTLGYAKRTFAKYQPPSPSAVVPTAARR